MRRTAVAVATALLFAGAAVGCSESGQGEPADKPAAETTASAEQAPALSKEEATQACVDAVAELEPNDEGEVPSEPVPEECASLSDGEYLDAYMDGISQSNQDGIDELERLIEEASKEAEQP